MPNADHLALILQGTAIWNEWREGNRGSLPDFTHAFLDEADLSGADLNEALLNGASLSEAKLRQAKLRQAKFIHADLKGANLSKADLSGAILHGANLSGALLKGADLHGADLSEALLKGADLSEATLGEARFIRADLRGGHLSKADLSGAILREANLSGADLRGAKLIGVELSKANLSRADLHKAELRFSHFEGTKLCLANLSQADISGTDLSKVDLSKANLSEANLSESDLQDANLSEANLRGTDLSRTRLIGTDIRHANLTGSSIYGIAAWDVKLTSDTRQENLIITPPGQPAIMVDNIKVAQFIYLLLNSEEVRHVIDTITSKAVLILGRFTPERKFVLDRIREELRSRGYLPIMFDFEKPKFRNTIETIRTLAGMSKFIIADLTDAKSVIQELQAIVPDFPSVPVRFIIIKSQKEPGMFDSLRPYTWVLGGAFEYENPEEVIGSINESILGPVEAKLRELSTAQP